MLEREKALTINEIYHSIQGESTWMGRPCVFVRLTFCDLRCNYCDTEYAFYEGKKQTLKEIVAAVAAFRCPLVEITGGEPLLQKNVLPLMSTWQTRTTRCYSKLAARTISRKSIRGSIESWT
jgi:7-carboxy-7-deazaguanine synthase